MGIRPQFSLAGLILLVVFISAVMAVVALREPWTLERSLRHPGCEVLDWSPDGRWALFICESDSKENHIPITLKAVCAEDLTTVRLPTDGNSAVFSPRGEWIVTVGPTDTVRVFDACSFRLVCSLDENVDRAEGLSIREDGRRIATVSKRGSVRIWEIPSGRAITSLAVREDTRQLVLDQGMKYLPVSPFYTPDGRFLVTGHEDVHNAIVWDAETGKPIKTLEGHIVKMGRLGPLSRHLFSPDGTRMVTTEEGSVFVWDVQTWNLLTHYTNSRDNSGLRRPTIFAPDGSKIWAQMGKV